jgi:Outer membrane protein beta-barrel domain
MANTSFRSLITHFLFIFSTISAISTFAYASQGTDVGVMIGVKDATFSNSSSGSPTFTSEAGVMVGAIAVGELGGDIYFRSGGYYTQREAKANLAGADATITFSYIDIPVTVMYKFNDMLGAFGGLGLGLKVAESCSGDPGICSTSSEGYVSANSFVTSVQLGLNAKFHPNWSGELFYEIGLSDVSTSTMSNSISADVMFIY